MITINGIIGSGGVIVIREQFTEYKLGLTFLFCVIGVQRRLFVEKISCCRWRKGNCSNNETIHCSLGHPYEGVTHLLVYSGKSLKANMFLLIFPPP